jgi:hypothetical protein
MLNKPECKVLRILGFTDQRYLCSCTYHFSGLYVVALTIFWFIKGKIFMYG